jgi:hypothetical protein
VTNINLKELHIKGGGNVQYVWQVAGMPWAVCESAALKALLDASTAARRAIFGTAVDGSAAYIADTPARCPIFTGLEHPGKTSWELQEIKGALSGGSWSVEIADRNLGHTWENFGSTNAAGTPREGLPGVHHIAQPLIDDTCAYAELAHDLEYDGTSLVVDQIGKATDWEEAVELDVGADGYRLAWIGGECLVLDNSVAGGTTVTILSRGAFMSRPQNHLVDVQGASPIVYDLPPSVAGQMCTLWACHMNAANSKLLATPIAIRNGRVSPDITTDQGITKININPILDNLDEEFTADFANQAMIRRFCFTRDESGTDGEHVLNHFQAPHLIIKERDIVDTNDYQNKNIWLCAQSEYVYFETKQDVIDALLNELACCSAATGSDANEQQVSGDGTANNGYVSLLFSYTWNDGYLYQKSGVNGSGVEGVAITTARLSLLGGPLAWLFNLGAVYNDKPVQGYACAKDALEYSPAPWFFYAYYCNWSEHPMPYYTVEDLVVTFEAPPDSLKDPWMICDGASYDGIPVSIHHLGNTPEERGRWCAAFYYEWLWNYSADCADWTFADDACRGAQVENALAIFDDKLFISPQSIYKNVLAVGNVITLGFPNDYKKEADGTPAGRYATATIATYSDDPLNCYITMNLAPTKIDGHPSPFRYGTGIFDIPALCRKSKPEHYWHSFLTEWLIQPSMALSADNLSDIFRSMLGDPNASMSLPYKIVKSNVNGFTTQGDLWSMIDWTDFDKQTQTIKSLLGLVYWIDINMSVNIRSAFWNECLLHGISPVLEFGWNSAITHQQWWIRFRKLGPANLSHAEFAGRTLTESNLKENTGVKEIHSHTWIANKIECEMNYEDEKYFTKIAASYRSSFIQGANETGTIKIKSQISHFTESDDNMEMLTAHLRGIIRYFAVPNWAQKCTTQINTLYNLPLGRECLVTNRAARNPATHSLGLSEHPAFMVRVEHDLGGDGSMACTYRLATQATYGWAPSCKVLANNSTKSIVGGVYKITCTPVVHAFSDSTMRADQMWFDCFTFNWAMGYVAKDCACDDYLVIAHELGNTTPTLIGGNAKLSVLSVAYTPAAQIVLVDGSAGHTHYNNWDTTKIHVISFDTWDNCEACQKKWIFFADNNNEIGADDDPAFTWL